MPSKTLKYVKLENGHPRPMPLFTDGICNMRPERAQWRRDNGYYPLGDAEPPACEDGKVPVRTGWAYDDPANPSAIVPVYVAMDIDDAPDHALRELVRSGTCRTLPFDIKDKLLARIGKLVLLLLLLPMSLFADPRASVSRFGDLTSDSEVVVGVASSRVSPLMWPGDWFIRIEGLEPQPGPSSYLLPTNDVLAMFAGGTGVWRGYRLSAEADPVAVRYGDPAPPVDFSIYDPSGAVASFTSNVLASSGVPGVAHVTGTDTNGVSREAAVVMTPVRPGKPVSLHAAETNVTERYLWAEALFSRLANVSTDPADMVEYNLCRSFANRYEVWKHSVRLLPRQLSRFGSDGRIRTNEWEALQSVTSPRAWALKQNRDFFWPELQTNLWCFSGSCHEGQGASAATKVGNWRNLPCIAVAPHYFITAAHYEEWPLSAWYAAPRFPKSAADNDWCVARPAFPSVGKARTGAGTDSDVRLFRVSSGGPIPDQCIARFAPERVLRRLSPTLFARVPCLTVNGHQAVTPYAATGGGSTYYGWTGDVGGSEWRTPYKPGLTVPAQASACVHTGHMYESGSPFFLAAPNGRVVPLGMGWYLNDGGGLSGNWLCDEGLLESLSAMVRADSGGTEDIKLWTFEDLYAGGVTNLTEVAQ